VLYDTEDAQAARQLQIDAMLVQQQQRAQHLSAILFSSRLLRNSNIRCTYTLFRVVRSLLYLPAGQQYSVLFAGLSTATGAAVGDAVGADVTAVSAA
jgi:hypothetical protein